MIIKKLFRNRIVRNAGWLMAGRIFHMILSFLIGLITARYLGPSNFGLINYASAYTTFFMAFCTLGINSVILKNFADHPDEEGTTIGTTLVLRLASSFLSIGVIMVIVRIVDGSEPVTLAVVGLYSVSLLFQAFDTLQEWFQFRLMSKYYAISTLISYTVASAYKVVLLVLGKSVEWFAFSNSVDFLIVAVLLYVFYRRQNGPKFAFSMQKAKQLLSVSCSYILSSLMVAIYAATDKLMLKQMMDESMVGYYALAVSISTVWAFVLSAIINSMKPSVMEYSNTDRAQYILMNKRMYALVFYISVVASSLVCLIAPVFIRVLYGAAYLPATVPLRIVVWYVAFSYLGVARDAWVVCENQQRYLKYLYLGSAVLNVGLNLLLIPKLGPAGAALASLATQISTIFVFPLFIRDFHPNVRMMTDAILLRGVLPQRGTETGESAVK